MDKSAVEKLKKIACDAIDRDAIKLHELSRKIWEHPELCFEEKVAHKTLTDYIETHGLRVERSYKLETAFLATYGEGRPNLAVLCEYDALPEIGHACGHNLIAEVGAAAGIGVKHALESCGQKLGKLSIMGTPAEEGGSGKIRLIEQGAFKEVDAAMMAHPSANNVVHKNALAIDILTIKYKGKASHAAGFPWEGINALDAAVMCYNNISVMRQQMKPAWRVHGVFTNGGTKPNIIPEETELLYYVRAPTNKELKQFKDKVVKCLEAAAQATGCSVTHSFCDRPMSNLIHNATMCRLYRENAEKLGLKQLPEDHPLLKTQGGGSTDMGNVSFTVPSIHPNFAITSSGAHGPHTREFTQCAGAPEAQTNTLLAAKGLACTLIDIYCDPSLLLQMKSEFEEDLNNQS